MAAQTLGALSAKPAAYAGQAASTLADRSSWRPVMSTSMQKRQQQQQQQQDQQVLLLRCEAARGRRGVSATKVLAPSSSLSLGLESAKDSSLSLRRRRRDLRRRLGCSAVSSVNSQVAVAAPASSPSPRAASIRETIRVALPSKGRMAEDTINLLKECELNIRKPNPRQYVGQITEMEGVEVWFQRASDVVRKLLSGDVDMGIVGYDMVQEYGEGSSDLVVVHEALGFGSCHLALAVPNYGIFQGVDSLDELLGMPQWTEESPLRVVTGYTHLGKRFLKERGVLGKVQLLTADGALEAAPAMGTADAILDLVSSGTTLKENNLKELQGGTVLASEGVLVVSRRALEERPGLLDITRELLERLEAHLRAKNQYIVTANMRGNSEEDVAHRLLDSTPFPGLQGPTISRVYSRGDAIEGGPSIRVDYFSVTIVVPKSQIYRAICALRKVGGSGVLVTPLTYIFDEEPPRWRRLLDIIRRTD